MTEASTYPGFVEFESDIQDIFWNETGTSGQFDLL
jgi:hypothetical protein